MTATAEMIKRERVFFNKYSPIVLQKRVGKMKDTGKIEAFIKVAEKANLQLLVSVGKKRLRTAVSMASSKPKAAPKNVLVARVRATAKGKTSEINGEAVGVKGRDGRKVYEIHKSAPGKWSCSCPAYRFTKVVAGKKKPCKHMLLLWHSHKAGNMPKSITVIEPKAL